MDLYDAEGLQNLSLSLAEGSVLVGKSGGLVPRSVPSVVAWASSSDRLGAAHLLDRTQIF